MPACCCVLLRQAHRFWWSKHRCSANQGDRRPVRYHTRTHRRAHKRLPLEVGLCIEHRGVSFRRVCAFRTIDRAQHTITAVVVALASWSLHITETNKSIQSDLLCTASEGVLRWMRPVGSLAPMHGERPNGSIPRNVPRLDENSQPIFFFFVLKLALIWDRRWLGHRVGTAYLRCTTTS